MSTNGVSNVEDSDMAEYDGEKVVTMMDVLQEEQDFEDDANAVLGASDEKNCTFSKGYIKRQAIYACLTCCTEAKDDPTKRAGVCLACSLNCHESHELVELYTKRNFRCDCGNPKFNSHPCQFTPNKIDLNEDNDYNQNFSGLYCTCHRPYPDPESTLDDDEMIQCIICEDWLHTSHLDAAVPGVDQYSEMICKACMEKNEFLHNYNHLAVNIELQDVDIVGMNGSDANLTNGELDTEKLVNGTDDTSMDTTEKPTDNMNVDQVKIEEKLAIENNENMDNLSSQIPVEENNEVVSNVTKNTEELSQDSDVNVDSKTDSNTDETSKLNEDNLEESATLTIEPANVLSEEETKVAETAEGLSVPQESNESSLENTEASKENQELELIKKTEDKINKQMETENPQENIEQTSENKIITAFQDSENDKQEESNIHLNGSDVKQEEISSITTADGVASETNGADNKVNDSSKEISNTENTDLPQVNVEKADSMETDNILSDLVSVAEIDKENETPIGLNTDEPPENKIEELNETEHNTADSKETKRKLSTEDTTAADDQLVKKAKLNEETCIQPKGVKRIHKGATFWPSNLRQKLCTCSECLTMYKDLNVLFLIDLEDTVFAYETLGKERVVGRATQYEKGLEALSSLDRIQQINALTEYNKMKDKLLDFLKSFKDRKEVVKEEDIKAFFAGMKPKKEPDGVYFCR